MIRHPNIVRFYGAVQESPNFCLITELCEGNLQDLLSMLSKKKVNVTWRLLWSIANGAAQALRYLHFETDTQIIHRDVKAEVRMREERSEEASERCQIPQSPRFARRCHLSLSRR